MKDDKRAVLITGCSDGGMGAALAKEFHRLGHPVYATARDTSKMESLQALGIETLQLDVQSESSIQDCAKKIEHLDILINNAGAQYTMPISDISLADAKKLFDTNFWGCIAVTQAFLPLLLKSSKGVIANHTSVGAGIPIPFQASYNASKAALSMLTETLSLELQPFDITVVQLRTGAVNTNIVQNVQAKNPELPADSIYSPAKSTVEKALRIEYFVDTGMEADKWAAGVVADLLKEKPPPMIWRGESATLARMLSIFPTTWFSGMIRSMTGLDKVDSAIRNK